MREPGDVPIVSSSGVTGYHSEAKVAGPGVVTGRYGTLGEVFLVPQDFWPLNTALYVRDFKGNEPRFVAALLQSLELGRNDGAAAVPGVNRNQLHTLPVAYPDLRTQRTITVVLGSLDDLIENNRRRIELLEQMAQAIYREWFVRFRYPGHEDATFVDSPLGPIPEGWEVRNLFDVAAVGFGFSFKGKQFAAVGPYPVIRIRDVASGTTKTFSDEEAPERYRVHDGDVLIGMDGDFHLRQWTGGDAWLNQRVARLRPLDGLSARHLMLAIAGPIRTWNAAITGTTVAHLGKGHLEQIHISVPPDSLLDMASEIFEGAADEACSLAQVARKLAGIRDLLLPKLVTGEIDVSHLDLDAVVESVA
jgi:type I restriction enzyme S subunit